MLWKKGKRFDHVFVFGFVKLNLSAALPNQFFTVRGAKDFLIINFKKTITKHFLTVLECSVK